MLYLFALALLFFFYIDLSLSVICNCGYYHGGTTTCYAAPCGRYALGGSNSQFNHFCGAGTYAPGAACSCTNCPKGRYHTAANNEAGRCSCIKCPVGKYQNVVGASSCKNCGVGKYQNVAGSSSCKLCPTGSYTTSTTASSCSSCPAGTYNPNTGSTSSSACKSCPVGKYQPSTRQASCLNCPVGKYQDETRKTSCKNCPVGQYQNVVGKTSCIDCPVGKYQDVTGGASCKDCSAGTFQDQTGTTSCQACSAGHYQDGTGSTACKVCPTGTFEGSAGSSLCDGCPTGTYNPSTASTASSACLDCPIGTFASTTGSSSCTQCAAGSYAANTGQSECTPCPTGTYGDSIGATDLSACLDCPAGQYNANTGQIECVDCPVGHFSTGGASACTPCPTGQYQDSVGTTSCIDCPLGKYSDVTGVEVCTNCATGTYQNEVGQTSCVDCPAGSFVAVTGQDSCFLCSEGTYQDETGQTTCKTCSGLVPDGYYCPEGSVDFDGHCPCGYYCVQGEKTPCGGGTFNDEGIHSNSACTQCPALNSCASGSCSPQSCPNGYFCPAGTEHPAQCSCNGHGNCFTSVDSCECYDGYSGSSCQNYYCFGDLSTADGEVCNGNGDCVGTDDCSCDYGWSGSDCLIWSCDEIAYSDPSVCSAHGDCDSLNLCSCDDGYTGPLCNKLTNAKAKQVGAAISISITLPLVICIVCVLCVLIAIPVTYFIRKQKVKINDYKQYDQALEIIKIEENEDEAEGLAKFNMNKKFFEIDMKDLKLIKKAGAGGFAEVFLSKWNGKDVAVKLFQSASLSKEDDFEDFERELEILSSISHPNIVRFFGCMRRPPRVGIVVEFCHNGDLIEYLKNPEKILSMNQKLIVLEGVASACSYLHSRGVIHRDLKSGNILLTKNMEPRLCDFGLSTVLEKNSGFTRNVGTSVYMAPELVTGYRGYTSKVDVFSFGIIMYEVIFENCQPYGENIDFNIEFRVATDPEFRPEMPENCVPPPIWYTKLMMTCWRHDPTERDPFAVIVKTLQENIQGFEFPSDRPEFSEVDVVDSASSAQAKLRKKNDGKKIQPVNSYKKALDRSEGHYNVPPSSSVNVDVDFDSSSAVPYGDIEIPPPEEDDDPPAVQYFQPRPAPTSNEGVINLMDRPMVRKIQM